MTTITGRRTRGAHRKPQDTNRPLTLFCWALGPIVRLMLATVPKGCD